MAKIKLKDLQIGDTFEFIPNHWYGKGKLLTKNERVERDWIGGRMVSKTLYDITFDAPVVSPPAVDYGLSADLIVKRIGE
jgi:hypothetical protein